MSSPDSSPYSSLNPWERASRGPRLGLGQTRERGDHDRSSLGLPPRIDDRATFTSYHLVIPHPRLRIDRFTYSTQNPQTREIILLGPSISPTHKGPYRSWSRIENGYAVFLTELPNPAAIRCVRSTLIHHYLSTIRQRSVYDVAVSRDPAYVSSAPVDVIILKVEYRLGCSIGLGQVPTRRVQHPLASR